MQSPIENYTYPCGEGNLCRSRIFQTYFCYDD